MKEKSTTEKSESKKKAGKSRKKVHRHVPFGIAHVLASFNNTIVTITDLAGSVIVWFSAGRAGYSGSRKSSAFAATVAAQEAGKMARSSVQMEEVEVRLNGPGAGREASVRGLQTSGLNVTTIRDATRVAHNGCRPRKRRRV